MNKNLIYLVAAGLLIWWLMLPPTPPDFDDLPSTEPDQGQIASVAVGISGSLSRKAWAAQTLKYKDYPYKWGGPTCSDGCYNDPANGLDCSGLMYQAARDLGVKIPRTATQQHGACSPISENVARATPGALVFLRRQADKFDSNGNLVAKAGSIVHVAMSTGDGRTVESWFNNKVVTPSWGWWHKEYSTYPSYYGLLNGTAQ